MPAKYEIIRKLLRSVQHIFILLLNRVTRPVIPSVDLRSNLEGVSILKTPLSYTPNYQNIHTYSVDYFWSSFSNITLDPLFYLNMDEVVIAGQGIIINKKGQVILESCIFQKEYLFKLRQNHLILQRFFHSKKKQDLPMVSLSNALENNYYHWIMESVTRIQLIESIVDIQKVVFLISEDEDSFKTDSMRFLFHIPPANIRHKPVSDFYKGSAVIPSFTHTRNASTKMTDICHPVIIKMLNDRIRDRLYGRPQKEGPRNLVISRKKSGSRRILNEDSFHRDLGESFSLVALEEFSFEDQVQLFFNASIIISTHGAGLTNIVFGKSVLVIELFPETRNPRDAFVFVQISSVLGFHHHVIPYAPCNSDQDVIIDTRLFQEIQSILRKNKQNK